MDYGDKLPPSPQYIFTPPRRYIFTPPLTVFCRGLSLFGALLALALLGMIVLAASTFFETLAAERRARIAVQQLTVLADASASHVHGRFPELMAAARGGPVEISLAQLKGAGSLPAFHLVLRCYGTMLGIASVGSVTHGNSIRKRR